MKEKFVSFIRKSEKWFLRFFVTIGRFVKNICLKIFTFFKPRWKRVSRTAIISVLILYIIGGAVFGIRLYKQKRFEKIDLVASYIYPLPVSHVGRSIIFSKGLNQKVFWAKTFAQKMQIEVPAGIEKNILEDMQNDSLIMQEAGKLNVKISRQDLDAAFEQAVGGIGGEEQAIGFIKNSYGMNLGQFKQLILPKVALEKIRDQQFAKVKARHIVSKDENKMKDLEKKIKEGAKFEDVAKDNSEDQDTKDSGGQLAGGEFIFKELSGLPSELEDELFKLKAGEVSGIVKSTLGYHLLKVDERVGAIDKKPTQWFEDLKKEYPASIWI